MALAATTRANVVDPVTWATDFLNAIGAPPTSRNISTVIAWGQAESGSASGSAQTHGGWSNFNPLNVVVQSNDSHTGQGGTQGNIADFGDSATGAKASARLFLGNANAAPIISALRAGSSVNVVQDAVNRFYSSWGGSIHFAGLSPSTAPGTASGGSTGGVQTTGIVDDIVSGALGPVLGPFVNIAGGPAKLAGIFVGIFTNWRYLAEVMIGGVMILFGAFLILHDIGATTAVRERGQQAATVAALA